MAETKLPKLPSLGNIDLSGLAAPGTNPQDIQTALGEINATYTPQENTLGRTYDLLQQNLERDVNAQQRYGQIADQQMQTIGEQLQGMLQGNVEATGQIYDQAGQGLNTIYDQAHKIQQEAGQGLQQSLESRTNALGLGEALQPRNPYDADPMTRLKGEYATLQGRTAEAGASSKANMATLGANMKAIAQMAVGNAGKETAQKRQNLVLGIQSAIGALQKQTGEQAFELMGQFADLAATKGGKFVSLVNQLSSARSEAEAKNKLDELEYQLKLAKFQQDQANADRDYGLKAGEQERKNYETMQKYPEEGQAGEFVSGQGGRGLQQWMASQGHWFDPSTPEGKESAEGIRSLITGAELRKPSQAELMKLEKTPSAYEVAMHRLDKAREGDEVSISTPDGSVVYVPYEVAAEAIRVYFNKYGEARQQGGTAGTRY